MMEMREVYLVSEKSCSDFWIEIAQTYPVISKMALKAGIVSLLESTVLIRFQRH